MSSSIHPHCVDGWGILSQKVKIRIALSIPTVTQLFMLLLSTLYLYTLSYFTNSRVADQYAICLLLFLIAKIANLYLKLDRAIRSILIM